MTSKTFTLQHTRIERIAPKLTPTCEFDFARNSFTSKPEEEIRRRGSGASSRELRLKMSLFLLFRLPFLCLNDPFFPRFFPIVENLRAADYRMVSEKHFDVEHRLRKRFIENTSHEKVFRGTPPLESTAVVTLSRKFYRILNDALKRDDKTKDGV